MSSDRPASSVDPKLLEILVCPLTKSTLEYDAREAGADLARRQARLSDPRRHPDHAARGGAPAGLISRHVSLRHARPRAGLSSRRPVAHDRGCRTGPSASRYKEGGRTNVIKMWGRKTSSNVQKAMWAVGEIGLAVRAHRRRRRRSARTKEPAYLAMNPNGAGADARGRGRLPAVGIEFDRALSRRQA